MGPAGRLAETERGWPIGMAQEGDDRVSARKANEKTRKRRSAFEYDPNTVRPQIATAATGTETYWDTPRIWNAAPTPANSLTVRPALAITSNVSARKLLRTENCSRRRPPRPLPE